MPESLNQVRRELRARIGEINSRAERLSPLDIYARMDAIRDLAGRNGMSALEGLAGQSAQLALLLGGIDLCQTRQRKRYARAS